MKFCALTKIICDFDVQQHWIDNLVNAPTLEMQKELW